MPDVTDSHSSPDLNQQPDAYCANCGAELDTDSQFCPQCGTPVDDTARPSHRQVQQPSDRHTSTTAEPGTGADTEVLGRRIGATIIDWIVGSIGAVLLGAILGLLFAAMAGSDTVLQVMFWLTAIPAFFLYYILLEANGGQTLGKKALGIKVVKDDRSDITLKESVIRNTFRIIDAWFYYLVGFIVILASSNNQRVGDKAAHTLVIRTK